MIPAGDADANEEERKRLMAWEVLSPTGIIEQADEAEVRSHLDLAEAVVRPFLPQEAPVPEITVTALWLVGQCVIFQSVGGPGRPGSNAELLVETILTLALRGLGA